MNDYLTTAQATRQAILTLLGWHSDPAPHGQEAPETAA